MDHNPLIQQLYQDYNARRIDPILAQMHTDVEWPKAFEGGYVKGHDAIRTYWTKQWLEINPTVEPVDIQERPDHTLAVTVHQLVVDRQGAILFEGTVRHVYTIQDGLLRKMVIELT